MAQTYYDHDAIQRMFDAEQINEWETDFLWSLAGHDFDDLSEKQVACYEKIHRKIVRVTDKPKAAPKRKSKANGKDEHATTH